jgi:HAMP domain-containing protein
MDGGHWEFWLNMTNLALGVVTFAAVAVVVGAIAWELVARRARKVREADRIDAEMIAMMRPAPGARLVPGLGYTMADGGEPTEPSHAAGSEQKPQGK